MMSYRGKMLMGMALGVLLIGGGLFGYGHAQNRPAQPNRLVCAQNQGMPMREVQPAEAAERIAEAFGVDQAQVQKAIEDGRDFRDIGRAAMLASVSGKSFDDVLACKTDDVTWRGVEKQLGITREQVRAGYCAMEARHLSEQDGIDRATALQLVQDGYETHDIRMAAALAKASGKDIQDVLGRKRINNRWHDVARELGVDARDLHLDDERYGYGYGRGPRCDFDDEAADE